MTVSRRVLREHVLHRRCRVARRKRPKGGQRSLREIAAELERAGHLNERGVRNFRWPRP